MKAIKTDCKHHWQKVMEQRGISQANPAFKDEVMVGMFCPKCMTATTVPFVVNRARSSNESANDLIYTAFSALEKQKQRPPVAQAMSPDEKLNNIITNLKGLGYGSADIQALLAPNEKSKVELKDFTKRLKEEHRMMAPQIFAGKLINL